MKEIDILHTFYGAFAAGDVEEMLKCYHKNVIFEDPAFGELQGDRARAMWRMLLAKKDESGLSVRYDVLDSQTVNWIASYTYGTKRSPVTNRVTAHFKFKDGKIIYHRDEFNLWKWSRQAIGPLGYLMGWSGFMKNKVRQKTNKLLDKFMHDR